MDEQIVKKIELDIDGVEVVLTPAQARKLHGALGELLGVKAETDAILEELRRAAKESKKDYVPMPYPVPQPYPVWPAPRYPRPWVKDIFWTVPCGSVTLNGVTATYTSKNNSVKMLVQ